MLSRREFFTSFAKPLKKEEEKLLLLRPPYSKNEELFDKCIECQEKKCVDVCEEKIIFLNNKKTPMLNFNKSGCSFCQECANVCEFNVLDLNNSHTINAKFSISFEACMAHNGVICYSCKEPCLDDAIIFTGMFKPIIDEDRCTSCGFCLSRCPTNAIKYEVLELKENV